MTNIPEPGPYSLANLAAEAWRQVPSLLTSAVSRTPKGTEPLSGRLRLAVWLRLARTLGCPVCVGIFPPIARLGGFTTEQVSAALDARLDALPPAWAGAVAWADAIVAAGGKRPDAVPEAVAALSHPEREQLLTFVRMERLVHATGLFFLPHAWVRRAAGL